MASVLLGPGIWVLTTGPEGSSGKKGFSAADAIFLVMVVLMAGVAVNRETEGRRRVAVRKKDDIWEGGIDIDAQLELRYLLRG